MKTKLILLAALAVALLTTPSCSKPEEPKISVTVEASSSWWETQAKNFQPPTP